LPPTIAVVTAKGIAPIEGGRGVIQLEEELMQENLPLWMKNHAFKTMDKQNKQLNYSVLYDFFSRP